MVNILFDDIQMNVDDGVNIQFINTCKISFSWNYKKNAYYSLFLLDKNTSDILYAAINISRNDIQLKNVVVEFRKKVSNDFVIFLYEQKSLLTFDSDSNTFINNLIRNNELLAVEKNIVKVKTYNDKYENTENRLTENKEYFINKSLNVKRIEHYNKVCEELVPKIEKEESLKAYIKGNDSYNYCNCILNSVINNKPINSCASKVSSMKNSKEICDCFSKFDISYLNYDQLKRLAEHYNIPYIDIPEDELLDKIKSLSNDDGKKRESIKKKMEFKNTGYVQNIDSIQPYGNFHKIFIDDRSYMSPFYNQEFSINGVYFDNVYQALLYYKVSPEYKNEVLKIKDKVKLQDYDKNMYIDFNSLYTIIHSKFINNPILLRTFISDVKLNGENSIFIYLSNNETLGVGTTDRKSEKWTGLNYVGKCYNELLLSI
jgi:hypothetical protein